MSLRSMVHLECPGGLAVLGGSWVQGEGKIHPREMKWGGIEGFTELILKMKYKGRGVSPGRPWMDLLGPET